MTLIGCGSSMPLGESAQTLEESSYPYPEESFNPDDQQWSASEYGSGSGYGDGDTVLNCASNPCVYGACIEEAAEASYCSCDDGYDGIRCERCAEGYAAIGCSECANQFECVLREN